MIDRGNGAAALERGLSCARGRFVRKALLASTALVAASFATPAMAQVVGNLVVDQAVPVTAPIGIDAEATGNVTVTARATIDSSSVATGTGIFARAGGSVDITTSGIIGLGTYFSVGIDAAGSAAGTNRITIGAHLRGDGGVVTGTGGFLTTVQASGEINAMSTTGYGVRDSGGGSVVNLGNIYSRGIGIGLTAGGSISNSSTVTGVTGVSASQPIALTNSGVITGGSGVGVPTTGAAVASAGGTIGNSGTLIGYWGVYNVGGALTVTNLVAGAVRGRTDAINIQPTSGSATINNSGTIETTGEAGSAAGIYIDATGNHVVTNSGTIAGGTDANNGYGIAIENGNLVVNNQAGGVIRGTAGAMRLSAWGNQVVNLEQGSLTQGDIVGDDIGTRTVTVAGTLAGNYDASVGNGVDTVTLSATGRIEGNVSLGAGDDYFYFGGGAYTGTIDGGAGTNSFTVDLGAAAMQVVDQSTVTNVTGYRLNSGTLVLTGSRTSGLGWTVDGGADSKLWVHGVLNGTSWGARLLGASTVTIDPGATLSSSANAVTSTATGVRVENSGTVTAGSTYSAIKFSGGTVLNWGSIANTAGGSVTLEAHGVQATGDTLNLTNNAGATVIGHWDAVRAQSSAYITNAGLLRGERFAGIEVNGTYSLANNTGGRVYGATGEGSGLLVNSGAGTVTNAAGAVIVGAGEYGIWNRGSGLLTVVNAGTIGSGLLDGSNNFQSGAGKGGIWSTTANIINAGLIDGASAGIVTSGALTLQNTGIIRGEGNLSSAPMDGVNAGGTLTLVNGGSILQPGARAVYAAGSGSIVTNGAAGVLSGGSGAAIELGAGGQVRNYGSATSTSGKGIVTAGSAATTIQLFAGSVTGSVTTGSGNDTLSLYTGRGTGSAAIVDSASGITLQNAGAGAAAMVGAIDLGGGSNNLYLRGGGDGTAANGAAGTLSLASVTNVAILTKYDSGSWTLTGTPVNPFMSITGGDGSAAGTLVFDLSGYQGVVTANGSTLRAIRAGGFGTGTLYALDPTLQYGATGTYSNQIMLMSTDPVGDPTRIQADVGVSATLTGLIAEVGSSQPVVFDGAGTVILTNGANNWTGLTTISNGTVVESNTASALGSGGVVVNAGAVLRFDNQTGGGLSIEAGSYTGAGTIRFTGNSPSATTILGNAGNVTFALGSGGLIDVQSGTVAGSASGQGFWTGNLADLNVASGATFDGVEGNIRIDALTGAGTVRNGYFGQGSLTLGVDNGSGTFSGALADSTNPNSPLILVKMGMGTQTLSGINSYTGSTTISGGTLALSGNGAITTSSGVAVASGATFDISGRSIGTSVASLTGAGAVVLGGNALTLTQQSGSFGGTVSGSGALVVNAATGVTPVFSGSFTNTAGLAMAAGDLTLSGSVSNNHAPGAVMITAAGETLGITSSGSVTSTATSGTNVAAVYAYVDAVVNNAGTITSGGFAGGGNGSHGIYGAAALTITNSGNIYGVAAGSGSTVRNNGVFASNASTLNNSGTILGGWDGAFLAGGGTVTNSGTLQGNVFAGLELGGTSTVTNQSGGLINGIGGSSGGVLLNGGTINLANESAATIRGEGDAGVSARGNAALVLANAGMIQGVGTAYGVRNVGTGALTVTNTGTITGVGTAISAAGQATVTNSGTINGNIAFAGGNDTVTLNGGAVNGSISLGAGSDAVYWNSGTISGTIDGGTGNDGFYLDRGIATTLDLAGVSGFEVQELRSSSLTLTGTRSGQYGWALSNGTTLNIGIAGQAANWGTVLSAVTLNGANTQVNIGAGSSVTASAWGITGSGANATIRNEGVLSVGSTFAAINLSGAGAQLTNIGAISVTNPSANYSAVYMTGANSSVVNSGTIAGVSAGSNYNAAVYLAGANSTVDNQSGGSITGQRGILLTGINANVTNAGSITASVDNGITLNIGGTVTNSGSITATGTTGAWGILIGGGSGSANNSGTINAGSGIWLEALGSAFTSNNSGTITGIEYGINAQSGALDAFNTSSISASQFAGVRLGGGGSLNNSGTIAGGGNATQGWGVAVTGGDATIINQSGGTITGGAAGAIQLAGSGAITVNLESGSTTTGSIFSANGGSRAVNIAGLVNGSYTASGATGSDTVTLGASGSIGSIVLGAGNDMFNWNGGSFAAADGGSGTDAFVATLSGSATLDLQSLSGFEAHSLNGGALTLAAAQASGDGGWTVNGGSLTLSDTAQVLVSGTAATLATSGTSLTVADGASLVGYDGYGATATAGTSITNAGLIRSTGTGFAGVLANGGTIDNQAAGLIAAAGNGITLQTGMSTLTNAGIIVGQTHGVYGAGAAQALINSGVIATGQATDATTQLSQIQRDGSGDGVLFLAGGSVTNQAGGFIVGNGSGVSISGGTASLLNAGTIEGGTGWGVSLTAGSGVSELTNQAGGRIAGGNAGAILLAGDGGLNVVLAANSVTTGNIVSSGAGARTLDISGTLDGGYDASAGAGRDVVTLRAGGSLGSAHLGAGDDRFIYVGGSIGGMIDGGAGYDTLFADFGAGNSGSVSLASFTQFEGFGVLSGNVTLTGTSNAPDADIFAGNGAGTGGTVMFDGTTGLTGDIYVNGGSIVANTAGAFGSGTIHMIDPTATFGATGTYGNNISLEVVSPSSADPATLNTTAGVIATLTGAYTAGTGAGVDPNQDLVIGGQGTIVLTNTANDWTGNTTINTGAKLQGASDTISGASIVNNGSLIYAQSYSGTVSQNISGSGMVEVRGLSAGNALTFTGTNTIGGGLRISDASKVVIDGSTSILLLDMGLDASRLDVTANGSLSSTTLSAVNGNGANQSVYNLGSISSTGNSGVYLGGADSLLDNGGTITGTRGVSVAGANAEVTNQAGATITGQSYSVYVDAAGATLANAGSVSSSSSHGVYLWSGGTVANSGSITGGTNGYGIRSNAASTITNQSGGTIGGGLGAVLLDSADLITINLDSGSTTNGLIASNGTGDRVVNILGTLNGGYAGGGSGIDAITLDTGATVTGALDGGAGNDTLALIGSGSATLGGVLNIESASKSGTGTWTIAAPTSMASWTIADGTLLLTGGNAIADTASVAMTGGTLQLGASEAIDRLSGTGNVALGANALTLAGNGTNFAGTISGNGSLLIGGTATLSGANAYAGQTVVAGTLTLGASNVLADASTLIVQTGGTVDLGANSDTVAVAAIGGTLVGTGTLTASQYELTGATVNASLGTGTVLNLSGSSALNGTAAGDVSVQGGTLALGASNRLADTATVTVASGATLDIGAYSDTVALLGLNGILVGTGTLIAAEYRMTDATVNANLGAGTLFNLGGTSTLNGNALGGLVVQAGTLTLNGTAGGDVAVNGGTLAFGSANRLADTANVAVASGATLDIGAINDTVGVLGLNGTLIGTGTLTASQYQLTGATVNANLGAGTVFNLGGLSALNGNAAGGLVVQAGRLILNGIAGGDIAVNGGRLALGASNRLSDTANVAIASSATLDIASFNDTVGMLGLAGTLVGTGTLTAIQYQLTGATVDANLGAGTVFNLGGISTLNGTAAGDVSVQGGTLALGAANRLADTAMVTVASGATFDIGAFSDTIGTLGLSGTLAGTGMLTAGQYQLTGATVNASLGAGTVFNLGGNSALNGNAAGALVVQAGSLALNGTTAGDVSVQGGTLALGASNRLADTANVAVASGATLNLGAFNDTIGLLSLSGTLAGTGTLTASQYQLNGATVNANLGAGNVFNLGGTSTLNGTAAGNVSVQAGTLALGASNRIADTATLDIGSNAIFNLNGFDETVGLVGIGGTLAGTGTLTASQYQLSGATVNANLAAGTLFQVGGISTLNGTSGANSVIVQAGTLRLGANERLANGATVAINTNATFDLAGYTETVGGLANGAGGGGTLALGAGKLIVSGTGNSGFSGSITGAGTLEKQGVGTLTLAGTFATTGRFDVSAGTLAFSGSTQGSIRVQGGTLIGSGTLAGTLTVNSGTFSPGGLATGALGAINPIGSFTTGGLVATGGTLLFDFGGTSLNFASDSIKVNGTATLTGGTVQVNALTAAASDYRFNQLYTIVQANALTGTFANGSVFATVASNPNLKWRLRYDLVANAVVLQVQKNMEFNDGVAAGDTNTLAVANALSNSTTGNASDQWASTLNTITALSTGQRVAAFKTFSGEILANVSTATISANNLFTDLLRQRVGDGSDALIGGGFAGSSLADVRTTTTAGNSFASALSGATLPGADDGDNSRGGIWGQVYGGYQKLLGDGVHAGVNNTTAGVAMGVETRMDGFTAGIAGGVAQIDSDMDSRYSTVSGNQYQLGGYLSYDAGSAFVAASGSWYSSDLNSKRTLALGSTTALATGDIHSTGYAVGLTGGFRTEFSNGLRLALIGTASKVRNQQDGYTENAAGGLGLQVASANRDLFTAGAELRLGAKVKTGAGVAMPWVSMGVRYNSGDLDTVGNVRFSGAPSGTGAFGVQGVKIAPVLGTLGVGIDARASKNVRLGIALEGSAGENTREGRASVRVKIGF